MEHHNHHEMMGHGRMDMDDGMDMGDMDMGMEMDNCTDSGMDMGGMMMYFHAGYDEYVLFKFWKIEVIWELILSMIALFVIAFLYEALKYWRESMFRDALGKSKYTSSNQSNMAIADSSKPVRYMEQIIMPPALTMTSGQHIAQTFLHMLQFFVSYCLMLVFMTYNVWLCLACLLGSGTGYFVFGWRKSVVVDITEHCH